jgi:putative hemolysin
MTAVEAGTPWTEIVRTFLETGYSRIPVYQGSMDHVIGVLYAKDVMRVLAGAEGSDLMRLLRPPTFVLEAQHIDDVLTMFRRQGAHMAIVVDEYGQVAGLVTIEDLLEELVGEIRDEYDQAEEHPFVQREDGSWLVDGMEAYDKVRDRVGLPSSAGDDRRDFTTLAGLIISRLDRLPRVGDAVTIGDYVLEVVDLDGRRIDKVLIRRRAPAPKPDDA